MRAKDVFKHLSLGHLFPISSSVGRQLWPLPVAIARAFHGTQALWQSNHPPSRTVEGGGEHTADSPCGSEELPPPPSAHTAQPSDQAGPQGDTQPCPKKCKQDVCVIVVPTMGFNISPGKSFQKELSDLAVFPQVSRRPYQGDREGRQTLWNTPLGGAAPLLPSSAAPFSIISNRLDGKHYALCSIAFCSE